MVDASRLIDELGRDDLDQRAVADHLVRLAKVMTVHVQYDQGVSFE